MVRFPNHNNWKIKSDNHSRSLWQLIIADTQWLYFKTNIGRKSNLTTELEKPSQIRIIFKLNFQTELTQNYYAAVFNAVVLVMYILVTSHFHVVVRFKNAEVYLLPITIFWFPWKWDGSQSGTVVFLYRCFRWMTRDPKSQVIPKEVGIDIATVSCDFSHLTESPQVRNPLLDSLCSP